MNMSSIAISGVVFACVFGGALLGAFLRAVLPEHHLNEETKDIMKVGTGLIATMAALVLGLLIASAKSSFDAERSEFVQMSANVVVLDRVLARYGPETKEARDLLRSALVRALDQIWPKDSSHPAQLDPMAARAEGVYYKIQELSPRNEAQRSLQAQALSLALSLGQMRWLTFAQEGRSIPMPFLVVLVFWITIIFVGLGLFAPHNATAIAILLVCALSVSSAIFLILELDTPFGGLIQISSVPLRNALAHLGQ
jgi:hypothetical protein